MSGNLTVTRVRVEVKYIFDQIAALLPAAGLWYRCKSGKSVMLPLEM